MKKKPIKHTQLSLTNPKRAGRPAKVDRGIRHISRERIKVLTTLHLTIKVRENKADIKSKTILKALHHAIKRARMKQLRILHYTLEYNHVHLLVEATGNKILHSGMQAMGISFSKAINKIKCLKGSVYKNRYHFRSLKTRRELKNAILYIFNNARKHKRSLSALDPFNSLVHEKRISADMQKTINNSYFLTKLRVQLKEILNDGYLFYIDRAYLWN